MASSFYRGAFAGSSWPATGVLLSVCPLSQHWCHESKARRTSPFLIGPGVTARTSQPPRHPRMQRTLAVKLCTPAAAAAAAAAAAVCCDDNVRVELQGIKEMLARMEQEINRLEDGSKDLGPIHRVVITGGPCGGKSTIIGDLKQTLEDRNYLVSVMPEIAKKAFDWSSGRLWEDHKSERLRVDRSIMLIKMQLCIEDAIYRMAKNSLTVRSAKIPRPRGVVILLDRGCADYKAHCSDPQWFEVLENLDTTMTRLRERRYDLVVHLVTAARGAEENYTLVQAEGDNSKSARYETPEEACALDLRTQQAWQGFPHESYKIVDNSGDSFAYKRQRVKDLVLRAISSDTTGHDEDLRRLLCQLKDSSHLTPSKASLEIIEKSGEDHCRKINVHMIYLSDKQRLQKRVLQGEGHPTYYRQTLDEDHRVVRQHQIDTWTYSDFVRSAVEANVDVKEFKQDLIVVTKDNASCRYHIFYDDDRDLSEPVIILEYDSVQYPSEAAFPPWLEIVRDVTSDDRYSTFPLA